MKHNSHLLSKALSLICALALTLSLAVPGAAAASLEAMNPADDPALGTKFPVAATIPLVTGEGGQDVTVTLQTDMAAVSEWDILDNFYLNNSPVFLDTVSVTLTRDEEKPYVNEELFPNAYEGGELEDWKISNGKDPQFTGLKFDAEVRAGKGRLYVEFHVNNFFGDDYSVPHTDGGSYIDRCGYYTLTVKAGKSGELEYKKTVKVVPYFGFNTMWEIYNELDNIVETGTDNGLYVEQFSMGQSTAGRDMPYLIVADDEKSVTDWLALTELAENDPDTVLDMIASGELDDIRVPVLYSNVHSNETAAADGVLAFAQMLVSQENISYKMLTGFTADGEAELETEMGTPGEEGSVAIPDLVADKASYLGYLTVDNINSRGRTYSGKVDLAKYYEIENNTIDVKEDLLSDVFFILVPEENVDGRTYLTRHSTNGYDLNRDNSFQTTSETANMQQLIGTFNPLSFAEFHGRVQGFQCEPCDPPHEPNFEYDLLSNHLVTGGEALGIGAVANNGGHNSYVMPQRDYLTYTGGTTEDGEYETYWADPWDDMSTSYTPQFAMLHGTVSYTVELPAYNDHTIAAVKFGILAQAAYVGEEKLDYLADQVTIFQRGVENANSNETVNPWLTDQYDVEGAEGEIFRPVYDGEGQNGNFYPECYIIPLDSQNQSNLQAASEMMEWLTRNHVKVNLTTESFTYDGVTYPAGTMIVSMYQAKRSVANGALYDGTLINGWTVLYSEGITTFNETRGFDMVTVAEPAAYKTISAACGADMDHDDALAYLKDFTTSFSGVTDADVILSNASEDSTAAINALLKAGKTVGMVTSGKYKGDFICSYEDYLTVAEDYILTATGVYGASYSARIIDGSPVVYLAGEPDEDEEGFRYTTQVGSAADWNYDRAAMELMNFTVTGSLGNADAIVGATELNAGETAAVQDGTPYIGYNFAATASWYEMLAAWGYPVSWQPPIDGVEVSVLDGAMDCLMPVKYPSETLVNASYIADGDDILYGYGLGYFTAIPEGAVALVVTDGAKTPTEGFIPLTSAAQEAAYNAFMDGGVQAFSYQENGMNIVLFANTLTNKVHQRDEYAFISNFLFSAALSEESYEGTRNPGGTGHVPSSKPSTSKPSETPETPESPVSPAPSFTDVPANAYYSNAVAWGAENGITQGTSSTTFSPAATVSREQLAAMLYRCAIAAGADVSVGEDTNILSYKDALSVSDYAMEAFQWACGAGIINGADGSLLPLGDITREQLITMLYRYAKSIGMDVSVGEDTNILSYEDALSVSDYAFEAFQWACGAGIINGMDGKLAPQVSVTRAQAVTILYRMFAK